MYGSQSEVKNKASFILACAGIGKRMGLTQAKQFLEYEGKPLFLRALLCAEASSYIGEIIIVAKEEEISYIKNKCKEENVQKIYAVVSGGKERQDSVFAGLQAISGRFPYIAVQDAVRPFCKEKYFEDCWKALEAGYDGAVVGVKVKDTIKRISGERVVETLEREELFATHTPQMFQTEILIRAHQIAYQEHFLGTDDASLVERLHYKVKAIFGEYDNVKITVPEDLKFLND